MRRLFRRDEHHEHSCVLRGLPTRFPQRHENLPRTHLLIGAQVSAEPLDAHSLFCLIPTQAISIRIKNLDRNKPHRHGPMGNRTIWEPHRESETGYANSQGKFVNFVDPQFSCTTLILRGDSIEDVVLLFQIHKCASLNSIAYRAATHIVPCFQIQSRATEQTHGA